MKRVVLLALVALLVSCTHHTLQDLDGSGHLGSRSAAGFLQLVQGRAVYRSHDGSFAYQFNDDGRSLILDGYTYTYVEDVDARHAIYRYSATQYYGVALSDGGNTIQMTASSGYYAIQWNTLGWEARLVSKEGLQFFRLVQGRKFSIRDCDESGLFGRSLFVCEFDEDASHALLSQWEWNVASPVQSSELPVVNSSSVNSGMIGNLTVQLDTEASPWLLTVGGRTYVEDYNDRGPSFLNRVKGAVFENGVTKYVFSADGRTLTMTYAGWYGTTTSTYYYQLSSSQTSASYSGWLLRLTGSDSTIQCATVQSVSEDLAVWGYTAHR